eukprot:g30862.t1
MLLGLFFVTVGFSFDVQLIANHWLTVIPLLLVLLLVKTLVVVALSRPSKLSLAASIQASALLAPGGEFALVLFRLAEQKELTVLLQKAANPSELSELIRAHAASFDGIHAVTSLWRISWLAETESPVVPGEQKVKELNCRDTWIAQAEVDPHGNGYSKVFKEVLPLLRQHLEEIPRRGLSNALMALAYLELWHSEGNGWCEEIQGNPQVLRRVVFALEDGIQQAMFHFCVGWKFLHWLLAAEEDVEELPLAEALAAQLRQHLRDANAQDLSNSAWAAARLITLATSTTSTADRRGRPASELTVFLSQLARVVAEKEGAVLRGFSPQGLANLAWAYATLAVAEESKRLEERSRNELEELFHALAHSAQSTLRSLPEAFKAQELSNLAWAYAKVALPHEPLFEDLAAAAQRRQGLSNLVWVAAIMERQQDYAACGIVLGLCRNSRRRFGSHE